MAPKKETQKADAKKQEKAKAAKGGGKAKKKKWSKGKVREKSNNLVLFDKPTYEKLLTEVPNFKLITPAILSDRLKINGSLARRAIKELVSKGLIRVVSHHHAQAIYTRATNS